MKTLSSLLVQTQGAPAQAAAAPAEATALIVGPTLCAHFRDHSKRFPRLSFTCSDADPYDFLTTEPRPTDYDFLVLQLDTLGLEHIDSLQALASQDTQVLVFYHYANKEVRKALAGANITLVAGGVEPHQVNEVMQKALRIQEHLHTLGEQGQPFEVTLPAANPRQFSEQDLIEAQKQANKLNCECPTHLTDLIRRLNAFEDYSKTCEVDSWQQAAIHACIYTYTNQARYLIEKALSAALEE